jgi:hypothetical protein
MPRQKLAALAWQLTKILSKENNYSIDVIMTGPRRHLEWIRKDLLGMNRKYEVPSDTRSAELQTYSRTRQIEDEPRNQKP